MGARPLTDRQIEGLMLLGRSHRITAIDFGRNFWPDWNGEERRLEIMASKFLSNMRDRGFVLVGYLSKIRVYDLSDFGNRLVTARGDWL